MTLQKLTSKIKYVLVLLLFLTFRTRWQQSRFGPSEGICLDGAKVIFLEWPIDESDREAMLTLSPGFTDQSAMTLSALFRQWLVERGASVRSLSSSSIDVEQLVGNHILAVSYEWFVYQTGRQESGGYVKNVMALARAVKRAGIRPLLVAPDTYLWALNLGYGLISSAGKGPVLVLQNTASEAQKLGIPNAIESVYWNWPDHRVAMWAPRVEWSIRRNRAVLPATGEPKRLDVAAKSAKVFVEHGWDCEDSGGRPWSEYVSLVRESKILLTTSYIPDGALSSTLEMWRPDGTVTGRVWDGFASGCLVITNTTSAIVHLGFFPGVHFWDLDRFLNSPKGLLDRHDTELQGIAERGHQLFLEKRQRANAKFGRQVI